MTNKGLVVLIVAVVIAVVAALALQQSEEDSPVAGGHYFDDLLQNVNQVAKVIVKTGPGIVSLVRDGGSWYVLERDRYPAANEKARAVILGLARLEKIEPKTSNPKLYEKLGVQGVSETNAESTLIELVNEAGKDLAIVIIGKTKRGSGKAGVSQMYVRRPNDNQAWLVEGSLPKMGSPSEWLRQDLVKVDASRVQQARITHSDGEVLTVVKKAPTDPNFRLLELATGETIESEYSINRIADSLRELRFEDVLNPDKAPAMGDAGVTQAELLTFDGLRITMKAYRADEKVYARLSAVFDQNLMQAQPTDVEGGAATSTGTSDTKGIEDKVKTKPKLQTTEQTRTEAKSLQNLWQSWVYVIPTYQFDNITVKKTDLLKAEKKTNAEFPASKLQPDGKSPGRKSAADN